MATMMRATDDKTGDTFEAILGLAFASRYNTFITDGQSLPDALTMSDVPTLVIPGQSSNKKFIKATWVKADIYMYKNKALSLGDWACNSIRSANNAIGDVRMKIDPNLEFQVLGYMEDGEPKLGIRKDEEKAWDHDYQPGKTITMKCQVYQVAQISPRMFPPTARAMYPYARDPEAIKSYQMSEISPKNEAMLTNMLTRHKPINSDRGDPITNDNFRKPLNKPRQTSRRLEYKDTPDSEDGQVYPEDPANFRISIVNDKYKPGSSGPDKTRQPDGKNQTRQDEDRNGNKNSNRNDNKKDGDRNGRNDISMETGDKNNRTNLHCSSFNKTKRKRNDNNRGRNNSDRNDNNKAERNHDPSSKKTRRSLEDQEDLQ